MSLSTKYSPAEVENKWYSYWMEKRFFSATPNPAKEPFCIVIPPPNVTGVLHMGHMLNNTIQDILVRKARMEGKEALWVPGTDHASIATEAKGVRGVCHKGQGQRAIEINERLNAYRKKAGALLRSEKGIAYRKKRCCDVEPVFGNMKHNKGFRRYFLRGIKKVAIETGLVYLAHNLKKAFAMGFTLPALNQA